MEHVLEHDAVRFALAGLPRRPPYEPVDRVSVLRLRERKLMAPAAELVRACIDPVRPGQKQLPAAGRAHRIDGVAVQEIAPVGAVVTQPAADLDHDGAL